MPLYPIQNFILLDISFIYKYIFIQLAINYAISSYNLWTLETIFKKETENFRFLSARVDAFGGDVISVQGEGQITVVEEVTLHAHFQAKLHRFLGN